MGSVWKGAHLVTGRKVAIKILDERFLSNVNVVQRFGREARAASAIQHEGIVEVLDLDQTEEGLPFLVMEMLEGETLSRRIERRGKLAQDEVVRIGTMLLEALEAAHQHGVVHRDLKPDNIFLVPAGRRGEIVKILDFGISSKDDEASAKLTMTGSVLGTPHYMSPEQAMGETNLDRRVDVYGAGVVLYECLVGDVPFDAPNYNKLLRVILDDDAVPPSKRGALIDARLEAVVLSALEKERDRRPQTARALLDRLKASLSDETERFGPEMAAQLAAADAERTRAARRSASTSFARPSDQSSASASATPTPAPLASGVRARGGSAQSLAAAAGSDLGGLASSTPPPRTESLDPPRVAAAKAPLRLDAPVGGGGGLGGLDDLDGLAPRSPSGSFALELDESALARPARVEGGSASSSGRHRAISERSLAASSSSMGAPLPRTTPSGAPARRSATGTSSSGMTAAARSHESLPAMRASLPPASPDAGTEEASPPPAPGGIAGWWRGLSDEARRWITLGVVGTLLFVGVVAAVRMIVRPGEDGPSSGSAARPLAADPDPGSRTTSEWVAVDVEGVPPRAQLRLDGLPGATLPLRVRRGSEHVLEIQAPGYEDRRLEFHAGSNLSLRADMRPAVGTTQPAP